MLKPKNTKKIILKNQEVELVSFEELYEVLTKITYKENLGCLTRDLQYASKLVKYNQPFLFPVEYKDEEVIINDDFMRLDCNRLKYFVNPSHQVDRVENDFSSNLEIKVNNINESIGSFGSIISDLEYDGEDFWARIKDDGEKYVRVLLMLEKDVYKNINFEQMRPKSPTLLDFLWRLRK